MIYDRVRLGKKSFAFIGRDISSQLRFCKLLEIERAPVRGMYCCLLSTLSWETAFIYIADCESLQ